MDNRELTAAEKNTIITYIKTLKYSGYTDEQINEMIAEEYVKFLASNGNTKEQIQKQLISEGYSTKEIENLLSEANWRQIGQNLWDTGKNFAGRVGQGASDVASGFGRDMSTPEGALTSATPLGGLKAGYRFARGFMNGPQQGLEDKAKPQQQPIQQPVKPPVQPQLQQQPVQPQPQQQPVQKPANFVTIKQQAEKDWVKNNPSPQSQGNNDLAAQQKWAQEKDAAGAAAVQVYNQQQEQSKVATNPMPADGHDGLHQELMDHGIVGKTFDYQVKNFRKLMGMKPDGGWTKEVADNWRKFKHFRSSL